MLYGNDSISYYSKSNVSIWMLLSFQAGMLNIGGFMACHRFVSHITGFATFLGYELTRRDPSHAIGMLIVPLFFLLGAMLSGQLVDIQLRNHKKPRYYISFGVIFFLLLLVFVLGYTGKFGVFGHPINSKQDYVLLILLCFTCGIQNGTITTVSRSVVRTTHLTGITTDLGIGLVRLLNISRPGEDKSDEKKSALMRIGIIFFFGLGSVLGGMAFYRFQYLAFILPVITSGILLINIIYHQLLRKVSHS